MLNLQQTLECGQCFRHEKITEDSYKITALGKVLFVTQKAHTIELSATQEELDTLWLDYFDMRRNYNDVKLALSANDSVMAKATAFSPGLHILNQNPWETLISYIISQHNAIPNIKRVVKNLCERYGKPILQTNHPNTQNTTFAPEYTFPTPESLLEAGLDGLTSCKTGFRAKYIIDACNKAINGEIPLTRDVSTPTNELRETLMKINGVGNKVADCTLLYGYSRTDCFPIDVWIKRLMEQHYFGGVETPLKEISAFATSHFGELSGFANIYLFNYRNGSK